MRRAALERDWTKGSIIGNLLLLSWPMVILQILYAVSQTVDMVWVGKLGVASIAGVGIASVVTMLVMSVQRSVLTGVSAMVARFVGAGDIGGANHVAGQAFILSAAYGAVVTVIGVFFAEPILSLFGAEADVVAEGAAYMRVIFAGCLSEYIWVTALHSMQASGDTVTPMRIEVYIRVIHVALCPFLVLGWWVFPHLGVSGAALSNVISQSLGAVPGLWYLFSRRTRLRLTMSNFRLDPNIIWRILKIGIPVAVMGLQRSFGNLVLMRFMVPFGSLAVAAHSLANRVETFIHTPAMGLGRGAGVLVGQNLGAGQPERAERSGWLAVSFVGGFMVACSVLILLWAENIIGIFSTEPSLVELGSIFLRIATAGYLMMALVSELQNCISGAGDTLPPMLISLAMIWAVQLPLAFLLPRVTDLGMYGVRWAMVAGVVVGAIAYTTYFRTGRWKRKKV